MYMPIAQSEILTERGMWISAEKHRDGRLLSVQKDNDIEGLSFLAVFISLYYTGGRAFL